MIDFRRLKVWHRAHALATTLMNDTRLDASARACVVGLQVRRTSLSLAANIAEGSGAPSHAQFARYLGIALASAFELDYFMVMARDANIWPSAEADRAVAEVTEIRRMLFALRRRVQADPRGQPTRSSRAARRLSMD